jgi:hypothetical protein
MASTMPRRLARSHTCSKRWPSNTQAANTHSSSRLSIHAPVPTANAHMGYR